MAAMGSKYPVEGECGLNICQDESDEIQATCRGVVWSKYICQDGSDEVLASCTGLGGGRGVASVCQDGSDEILAT